MLVSGWARRATFLWAVLPFFAVSILERIAFGSSHFALLMRDRVIGFAEKAFDLKVHGTFYTPALTPGRFLSTPSLWLGLILAATFIASAVRMRRNREPI